MRKNILVIFMLGVSVTLSAQKLTGEIGMGFGSNLLVSGESPSNSNSGGMGFALHLGMRYHFDPQFSLGVNFLAQDPISGTGDERTASQVTFSPESTGTSFISANGRYAFNKKNEHRYFFVGLGLGWNQQSRFIRVNDVEKVNSSGLSLMPEIGYQWKRFSQALSITTPVTTPTFDQVGNEDGRRYLMNRGRVSTITFTTRYYFRLFGKKIN